MIDVISPCVTFNDHEGSTKSYSYVKDHDESLSDVSFVPFFEDINVEYDAGTTTAVTLHNGSKILLSKLAEDYHPTDKMSAMRTAARIRPRAASTPRACIYVEPDKQDFVDMLGIVDEPLATLPQSVTRPGKAALDEIMESFR